MLAGLLLSALPAFADAPASFDASDAYVHMPPNAGARGPLQVVVALHGMGGEGKGFCQSFLSAAERNGWVVVAPTFKYRNWKDPATVAEDDVALTRDLAELLDGLPARLGVETRRRAVLVGFSRGAQLAHRFAFAYPERTRAVAAMSAGTYTLPGAEEPLGADDRTQPLRFPFGTADLEARLGRDVDERAIPKVPFWIAVGANDDRAEDVPRQWDNLLGKTRVQRAQSFARRLTELGAPVTLTVFPNVGHAMAPEMSRGATAFLEQASSAGEPTAARFVAAI